jgi:hypothetical protein
MLLPHQPGDGWQAGLSLFQLVVDRLRSRGVDVAVQTRPTSAGSVFMLTLGGAS